MDFIGERFTIKIRVYDIYQSNNDTEFRDIFYSIMNNSEMHLLPFSKSLMKIKDYRTGEISSEVKCSYCSSRGNISVNL